MDDYDDDELTGNLIVIGRENCETTTQATNGIVIGNNSTTMNYSRCLLIGDNLKATQDNHVVILDLIDFAMSDETAEEALNLIGEGIRMILMARVYDS